MRVGNDKNREGWTLIETLVAVSVLGILLAILIPAAMSARESSRRLQCVSHLREFGVALHGYETTHNRLPPLVRQTGIDPDTNLAFSLHLYSPHTYLLPYLDQTSLFDSIDLSQEFQGNANPDGLRPELRKVIAGFLCPSDAGLPGTNYRCCTGPRPLAIDGDDWWGGTGAFANLNGVNTREFLDGLSNTVLMSERRQSDNDLTTFSKEDFWFAGVPLSLHPIAADDMRRICGSLSSAPARYMPATGRVWIQAGYAHTLYNHVFGPNAPEPDCAGDTGGTYSDTLLGGFKASSRHTGGVNTLFGDGSVRFTADQIDLELWRALATRRGGEIL